MDRWKLAEPDGIVWDIAGETRLPHTDHIELSGRRVSVIVRYGVDEKRRLTVSSEVIWPTLRLAQHDVRGYLKRTFGAEFLPLLTVDDRDDRPLNVGPVREIRIFEGRLTITHELADGLVVQRHLFPSPSKPALIERWTIINFGTETRTISASLAEIEEKIIGYDGDYLITVFLTEGQTLRVRPGEFGNVSILYTATKRGDAVSLSVRNEALARESRWKSLAASLHIETPDPVLNHAFAFARFRAAESLFDTKMGLVHSPGGGRYYGGVWANDQAEYAGPLFGYLGDPLCHEATMSCYRRFFAATNESFLPVPSSFEVEGDVAWSGAGDRGDAAMIASGASRYALARGEQETAEELWPLIVWCLEFCRRKTDERGVILSDSDELEGRFPSGDANLSTACLAYDGYRRAADLARELGKTEAAITYDASADALASAIEAHFGATIGGFETYRYYEGNKTLRAWICLPLVVGLTERTRGTVDALFSPKLWTEDGLATEAGDTVYWDRSTLYALRGVFFAGETETALAYLSAYSRRRLLGEHVPYPVEAYPEGGAAHLAAESALYCRVFTEGLLGLVPTGFRSFTLTPRLPKEWPHYTVTLTGFGHTLTITITRTGEMLTTEILASGTPIFSETVVSGATIAVTVP